MIELRHLRTLERIVALGSQARAADELGHAPSAVALHLRELERRAGGELLSRNVGRIELTARGRAVLAHARRVHDSTETMYQELGATSGVPVTVAVGSVEPLAGMVVVPALADLLVAHPAAMLDLRTGGATHLAEMVATGEVAIALSTPETRTGVAFRSVHREPLVVAAPLDEHPLPDGAVDLSDLAGHPVLVSEPGCAYRAALDHTSRLAVVELLIRGQIGSPPALQAAVTAGLAMAIGPRSAFDPAVVAVRPLRHSWVEIGWLSRLDVRLDPLIGLLVAQVERALASAR